MNAPNAHGVIPSEARDLANIHCANAIIDNS